MKKLLLPVVLLSMSFALSSCIIKKKSSDIFQNAGITDFTEPETKAVKTSKEYAYYQMTEEEFHAYAEDIYEYLLGKDYTYFGTQGNTISTLFGGMPTYEFVPTSSLSDHYDEEEKMYQFVVAMETTGETYLKDDFYVSLTYTEQETYSVVRDVRYNEVLVSYKIMDAEETAAVTE